ncbi:MAG: hypothetical protein H6704_28140 [Myxococcales bacterium]|nr:hypothetical protein [Myxococcales bacterium]
MRGCGPALGRCRPGLERCGDDGTFGECVGGQGPTPETCDGVDEDCDGRTDEGLTRVCGEAVGACRTGRSQCVDGAWTPCDDAAAARDEVCDGVDDDCDGAIDEGLTRPCGPDTGRCVAGIETCVVGAWGLCEGGVGPAPERCNGVDDDCDGATDEQLALACAPQGGCDGGYRACEDGAFGDCLEAAPALPEACDGLDNDCDGQVDEALVLPCGSDVGACLPGLRACVGGAYEAACVGEIGPAPEVCDGEDQDCDGRIDEDAPTRPCGFPAVGRCAPGRQRCVDGAYAEACVGGIGPLDEDCNGVDDDCDGDIDEGIPPRPCGSDVGECRPGLETCDIGGWGRCEGRVRPVRELCNRLDDDCDGHVDEGIGLDDDEDGIEDCVELDVGLDPSDPTDALGDFDHDGTTNADEVAMGTPLWSTLYLHPVATRPGAPADQIEVSLRLYQPTVDLQPEIAEIYIFDNGEVADLVEVQAGPSAIMASKDVIGQTLNAFETRIVIVAPNLDRMPTGELARLILRRRAPDPISIRVLRAPSRFAPAEADAALTAGTAAHRVPLEIP